ILGPFTALSAAFAAQAGELLQSIQSTVAGQARGNVLALTNVPWVREGLDWLEESFSVDVAQLQEWARQGAREVLQSLASLGGKVFMGAIGTVVGFVMMFFMLFFFIRDGAEMVNT